MLIYDVSEGCPLTRPCFNFDYEEDELQISTPATAGKAMENGKDSGAVSGEKAVKKGYVGVHSTGFRDFLLKPELLRAIVDCGFEHPSEGMN